MDGVQLTFYVHEDRRIHGALAWEWLLEQARGMGIGGGSVFRGMAGFGHHGVLHEDHFFELAGNLPVAVYFILSHAAADALIATLAAVEPELFYVRCAAQFGLAGQPGA